MEKILKIAASSEGREYVIETSLDSYLITAADFKKLSIHEGDEIDEKTIDALNDCAVRLKCIKKAFSYLAYGDMSKKKLYLKLTKHFDKKLSAYVAKLMEQRGYINENEQALAIAEKLYHNSLFGRIKIKSKLYQLMFDSDAIDYAMTVLEADAESDEENINELTERKFGGAANLDRDGRQKATAYLVRMGYSYDAINDYFLSRQ